MEMFQMPLGNRGRQRNRRQQPLSEQGHPKLISATYPIIWTTSLQTPVPLKSDSTDSEPNSNVEGLIDDTKVPINSIAPNAKAVHLAALYSAPSAAEITKTAEMAKGGKEAKDKENGEPCDSSDDIEIIDAPIVDRSLEQPSNIIDCESVDI